MKTLEKKVALVSGSGRGIGRAVALKLASAGARIVVNDLDDTSADQVMAEIRTAGGEAVACIGTVTAPEFAERFIRTALDAYGEIDIIVNNAGYTWNGVIESMSDEQWHAMLDCHLTAPFRILRAAQPAIRRLVEREQAAGQRIVRRVINISSISGLFGNAEQVNYSAAKAGIVGLTKTLAKEWGRLCTTVNCVAFGLIRTRLAGVEGPSNVRIDGRDIRVGTLTAERFAALERAIPLGQAGTPEQAAGAVYLFALPEADHISGQVLMCTGGQTGF